MVLVEESQAPVAEVPPPPEPVEGAAARGGRRHRRRRGGGDSGGRPGADGASKGLAQDLQQVEWMIGQFKTLPCTLESTCSSHDHRCCPFFHSERDRRRPVAVVGTSPSYLGEPCPNQFDDSRVCPHGDACTFCHSTAELLYHPDFFRKRLCHQSRRCPRGRFCAFAHARQELLVPHFDEAEEAEPTEEFIAYRFKTQWCPVGGPHDWESCVYAHTYRDWRRAPILGYSSHPCPRWAGSVAGGTRELGYSERCPFGVSCPLSHGAKEQLYHPQFYKTSPCSDGNCRRGPLCAFTHGDHDQRSLPVEEAATRSGRKPIPQAEELLMQVQPTFAAPPMYHALEDTAPRAAAALGGGGGTKARGRRGRGGGKAGHIPGPAVEVPKTSPYLNLVQLPHVEGPPILGDASSRDASSRMPQVMFGQCPYLCQWMPMADPMGQLLPPMMGYASADQVPQMVWQGQPGGPGVVTQMVAGGSPSRRLAEGLGPDAGDRQPQPVMQFPQLPLPDGKAEQDVHLPLPLSLGLDAGRTVNLAAWRKNCQVGDGWRTPSSFGLETPPLSGTVTPTATSSPRNAEASTSTEEESDHGLPGGAWASGDSSTAGSAGSLAMKPSVAGMGVPEQRPFVAAR